MSENVKILMRSEWEAQGKALFGIYLSICDGCKIVEDENARETRIYIGSSDENIEKRKKEIKDLKKKYNDLNTKEDSAQYQLAFIAQMNLKHFYFGRMKKKKTEIDISIHTIKIQGIIDKDTPLITLERIQYTINSLIKEVKEGK